MPARRPKLLNSPVGMEPTHPEVHLCGANNAAMPRRFTGITAEGHPLSLSSALS